MSWAERLHRKISGNPLNAGLTKLPKGGFGSFGSSADRDFPEKNASANDDPPRHAVHPVTLPPSIEGIPLDAIRRWAGADWPELAGNPDLLSAYVRAAIEAGELAPPRRTTGTGPWCPAAWPSPGAGCNRRSSATTP